MQIDSIVQLIESGNYDVAEQEWMSVVERDGCTADEVIALQPLLGALLERKQRELAESLAWAAVETLSERRSAEDALSAGKPFLLLLNRSDELRGQVAKLYRAVYADRSDLEVLLEASGIDGGRPPRRAMRTLDFCLGIKPGSYLTSRHEDSAARVESIQPSTWQVTVNCGRDTSTLGPVECADQYAPCNADDFQVMSQFDPEGLGVMAEKEPAKLIENILRTRGEPLNSDELEGLLTRRIVDPAGWSKWWSKARAAIKRSTHIKMEGRSPYVLEYAAKGTSFEHEFETGFLKLRSASEQLAALEVFLRECKARKQSPDGGMLGRLRDSVAARAERLERGGGAAALPERLLEWQIGCAMGEPEGDGAPVGLLASAGAPGALIRTCDSASLWRGAFDCLQKAQPDHWVEVALELLPVAPGPACDDLARRLEGADVSAEQIEQVVGTIFSDAVGCFEGLCWLWDKGLSNQRWNSTPPVTVLSKLVWLMGEIKRDETLAHKLVCDIRSTVRSALSARKYGRFIECLSSIESGMGAALRTGIKRLDNLGRNTNEDLLNRIRDRFPELWAKPETPQWAMQDVIFSTEAGIARWGAEVNDLVNVKMRENARAIGEAAEKGDLSENSEYKFALEERDLLRARLAHMQGQLSLARRILPEQVPADHISMGSKVQFRHVETGIPFEATFLGPFEAVAEQRIYNYQSPLGQEVMGLGVGDRVELPIADPPGAYEIVGFCTWDVSPPDS